jgi:hypothetical protein
MAGPPKTMDRAGINKGQLKTCITSDNTVVIIGTERTYFVEQEGELLKSQKGRTVSRKAKGHPEMTPAQICSLVSWSGRDYGKSLDEM